MGEESGKIKRKVKRGEEKEPGGREVKGKGDEMKREERSEKGTRNVKGE